MLQQLLKIFIVSTKFISLFHFKRIYNQFQSSVHPNTYSTAYIVHQKAWKIAASKSYIFQNFSFLLLLSYHTFVPKKFRLDEKRSFVTNALKTRFAYIRPVSFSSAIPCFFFFFFCYTWKYELWYSTAILSGIEAELKAKIVASWNEQPLSPVKTGNRNSWLQRQPNSLGYYVAKIPFERS